MKESSYYENEARFFAVLPLIIYGVKRAIALLEEWIKCEVISLPAVEFLPTVRDWKDLSIVYLIKGSGIV